MRIRHLLLALALVALGAPASPGFAAESPLHAHPWLPGGKPGKARASLSGESATLRNDVLEVRWELPRLRLRNVAEPGGALLIPGPVDAFRMRVDGRDCRSSSMRMNDPPRIVKLRAEPGAVNWGGGDLPARQSPFHWPIRPAPSRSVGGPNSVTARTTSVKSSPSSP